MQMKERSLPESLPDVLDQALAQLHSGASVEDCLVSYPEHAAALEPLLRAGDLLNAQATIPLPAEMEDWLATGAHDFAAIAAHMAPKYAKPPQTTRQRARATAQAQHYFDDVLDLTIARARRGESIEACLADYPEQAAAIDPLLRLGTRLYTDTTVPLPPELVAWLPTGRREFMTIAEQLAPRQALARQRSAARRLTAQRAAVAVVVVGLMMGAVDSVSAQSLPGDTLYPWKRAKENISLALVADPAERSQLLVEYANRRLDEFNNLVANGQTVDATLIAETLNSMLANVEDAIDANQQAPRASLRNEADTLVQQAQRAIQAAKTTLPNSAASLASAEQQASTLKQQIAALPEVTPTPDGTTPAPGSTSEPAQGNQSNGGGRARPTNQPAVVNPSSGATGAPTDAGAPTSPLAPTNTATPLPGDTATALPATAAPTNTATADPATAIPPTVEASPAPSDTPVNTPVPTSAPTNTPVPTATAVPVTEVPTEPPPPTVPPTTRPTRVPPTDTPVPTDAPPTDTPVPTDVPPTDTPVPTDVPPTDTPVAAPLANTDTPLPPSPTPAAPIGQQPSSGLPSASRPRR
ncbi:MAG TPA: DUF5667 domain-containing protein [Kouleothrix sp.]|nr:DUF5667 domain-containing protein [Kouleothrix sp.]